MPGVANAVDVAAGAGFCARCWPTRPPSAGATTATARSATARPASSRARRRRWSGLTGARALSAHWQHACAIRDDQTLVCWGSNATGQLGDGTLVNRAQPAVVVGLSGVTAVAAGLSHTCAISAAGLSCWGSNSQGQLGANTGSSSTPATTPTPVTRLTNPVAVAAGAQHTCAVRDTGAVLCWGQNSTGQLGEGSMSSLAEPVPVSGLDTGLAVAAGATFSCATTSDGAVFCWGDDHDGQLGTGRGVTQSRPVRLDTPLIAWRPAAPTPAGSRACHRRPRRAVRLLGLQPGGSAGRQRRRRPRAPRPHRAAAGRAGHRRRRPAHLRRRRDRRPLVLGTRRQRPAGTGSDGRHARPDRRAAAGRNQRRAVRGGRRRPHLRFADRPERDASGGLLRRQQSRPARRRHADRARGAHGVAIGTATSGAPVIVVAAGGAHSCATDAAGQLWCWGRGDRGQLGNGAAADLAAPAAGAAGWRRRQGGHGRRIPHLRRRRGGTGLVLGRQ